MQKLQLQGQQAAEVLAAPSELPQLASTARHSYTPRNSQEALVSLGVVAQKPDGQQQQATPLLQPPQQITSLSQGGPELQTPLRSV
jgi:hypothetical protein